MTFTLLQKKHHIPGTDNISFGIVDSSGQYWLVLCMPDESWYYVNTLANTEELAWLKFDAMMLEANFEHVADVVNSINLDAVECSTDSILSALNNHTSLYYGAIISTPIAWSDDESSDCSGRSTPYSLYSD